MMALSFALLCSIITVEPYDYLNIHHGVSLPVIQQRISRGNPRTSIVTAYCTCKTCCGENAQGITYSGLPPQQGVTVAGPTYLPIGTKVYIEGVGERIVQDRTAHRYDGRFDVYFEDHQTALKFGKRELTWYTITTEEVLVGGESDETN